MFHRQRMDTTTTGRPILAGQSLFHHASFGQADYIPDKPMVK
jgi:hypothetical protein